MMMVACMSVNELYNNSVFDHIEDNAQHAQKELEE